MRELGGQTAYAGDGGSERSPRARLRGLVTTILAAKEQTIVPSDEDTLAEIGITSFDMVTLLLSLESEFDVEVPPHEITPEAFRSIATIDALLQRLFAPALAA